MALLVMKFGGTSVADLARIEHAAKKVEAEVARGYDVIVIVFEDLINRLGKGVIALLFKALLFPEWGNLVHTLEVQPVTAHGT